MLGKVPFDTAVSILLMRAVSIPASCNEADRMPSSLLLLEIFVAWLHPVIEKSSKQRIDM